MARTPISVEGLDDEDFDDQVDQFADDASDPDAFFARNAFRLVYQTNNFFLPQVKDLVEKGEVINLRPEYQRRIRWTSKQKSRLIESLLLNIPVPPVFFYESEEARYEVMDGQQRLNAIREFLAGDFALSGLQVLWPLNRLRYRSCPPRIKRTLERSSISAIILLIESGRKKVATGDDRLSMMEMRRFIFERLNTGGTKLNKQEMRNALYPSAFNELIISLSRNSRFTEVFDIPPYTESDANEYYENPKRKKNKLYATMGDCQLILRYFALRDEANIRGSMNSMLDRTMERHMRTEPAELERMKTEFVRTFEFLYELFEGKPFRLNPDEKGVIRISASLYDALMVATARNWRRRNDIVGNGRRIAARIAKTLETEDLGPILTGQGNTALLVKQRVDIIENILLPNKR